MNLPSPSSLLTKAETTLTPGEEQHTNVGELERWASALGGGALAAYGLDRLVKRSMPAGLAAALVGGALLYRGVTGYCPGYGSMGVSTAERQVARLRIRGAYTIKRPAEELYQFWRNLENLPHFMQHLEAVQVLDDRRSRWRLQLPLGFGELQWEAVITEDQPGRLLAWHSVPEAMVETAGHLQFREAPEGRGTELHAVLEYRPPAGAAGATLAGLANPLFSQLVREDLRRFKNLMEAGEIPTTSGQPVCG